MDHCFPTTQPFWLKPLWLKPFLGQDTSCCSRVCQMQFGLFVINTTFLGRNRKFVLEDDLHDFARSTAAISELGQPTTKPGISNQAQPSSRKKPSDFDTTPSFPLSRRGDGCCAQSSGEVEDNAHHFGRRRRDIDLQGALQKAKAQAQEPLYEQSCSLPERRNASSRHGTPRLGMRSTKQLQSSKSRRRCRRRRGPYHLRVRFLSAHWSTRRPKESTT